MCYPSLHVTKLLPVPFEKFVRNLNLAESKLNNHLSKGLIFKAMQENDYFMESEKSVSEKLQFNENLEQIVNNFVGFNSSFSLSFLG